MSVHTLDFRLDERLEKENVDAREGDPDLWIIEIECHDTRPTVERECRMWIECGPEHPAGWCAASPSGYHDAGQGRYWSSWCWAKECDMTEDAVIELITKHNLSFGSYPIDIDDSGENYIAFTLAIEEAP